MDRAGQDVQTESLADSPGRLRDVAWWLVLGTAFVGPLLTSNLTGLGVSEFPYTYDQHYILRAVLVTTLSFGAVAFTLLDIAVARRGMRIATPLVLLAAFLLLAGISTGASRYRATAVLGAYAHYEGLVMLLAYGSLCIVVLQLATPQRLRGFARAMTLAGGLVAAYGVVQMLALDRAQWYAGDEFVLTRAFSTWGNPDFLGVYLVMPLAFSAVLSAGDSSRPWRIVGGVSFALIAFALVGTINRGSWIAAGVVLAVEYSTLRRLGWRIPLPVAAVAVLGAIVVLLRGTARRLSRRLGMLFSGSDTGVSPRFWIWRETVREISNRPLLGGGPDTFVESTRSAAFPQGVSNDAHNYVLQSATTVGIPATLSIMGFFGWTLARAWRSSFRSLGPDDDGLAAATWAAAAGCVVALQFSLSQSVSAALLFCCLGVLLRPGSKRVRMPRAVAIAGGVVALVAAVGCLVIGSIGIAADAQMMQARIAAHQGGAGRVAHARRAVQLNPYNERYREELEAAEAEAGR